MTIASARGGRLGTIVSRSDMQRRWQPVPQLGLRTLDAIASESSMGGTRAQA